MGKCYDCGISYGVDGWIEAVIPNKIWNEISPRKSSGGLLCICCISKRLYKFGYPMSSVPIMLCGMEPIYTVLRKDFDIKFDKSIIHYDQSCNGEIYDH